MITTSQCQHCSQLPPPPPIFSLGPPPNILSLDIRCSSRLFSSSIQHKKIPSSSSSTSVPITLGILITLLIFTGAILYIKNRMIKRRRRQRKCDNRSLSVKFTGHQNRTNFIPLLSDSCSSDHTISTPLSEYPCNMMESFLSHEYEQIDSSHYYCLIYCRQCGNYHQTSRSSCTCHLRNDNHFLELQPMFEDLNH